MSFLHAGCRNLANLETLLIHFHVSQIPDNFISKYIDCNEKYDYMENNDKFNNLGTFFYHLLTFNKIVP